LGATKNFFREKKGWSLLKDNIFAHYLKPYIAKILHTYRPLHIYDCFAGKGIFDDGNKGSPIIIAEHINESIQKNPGRKHIIFGHFIENKYAEELSQSLEDYQNCEVLEGSYEQYIKKHLLDEEKNCATAIP
jgi:three-Cys-motif partner protein